MSLTIYADESKARGFRFAATLVSDRDAAACRATMSALRKGPTRRIHFKKEKDSTRKAVLSAIRHLPVQHVVVEVARRANQRPPRERGLVGLAQLAHDVGAATLVLERDPAQEERDRRVLYDEARRLGDASEIRYCHRAAKDEPLLWIPDAVAWSWTRGGEWRRLVVAMGTRLRQA